MSKREVEDKDSNQLDRAPTAWTAPLVHERAWEFFKEEPPGKVLDVPAGEGAFSRRLAKEKFEVWCGDIQKTAQLASLPRVMLFDLDRGLPIKAGTFDYITCLEGVEHVENPHLLIREFHRVLKTGGKCILSTPNVLSIKSRLSYLLYGYPNYFHLMVESDPVTGLEKKIDHINPVTFLELRYILAQNGFSIERVEANRLQKKKSALFYLLRKFISTRGRSHGRDLSRVRVRQMLLSDPLLHGEVLLIKARKRSGAHEQ